MSTFHRGLSLFVAARRTRKRKYTKAANKVLATMKKWLKAENPNVVHTVAILEAEQFALKGQKEKACEQYEKSITLSARRGMIHDAALACERLGEYLLNEVKDEEKAVHCLEKSLRYYKEWGAQAKVAQLNDRYSGLWEGARQDRVCE